jgi:tetratricopeptide (TPR) repeat protein
MQRSSSSQTRRRDLTPLIADAYREAALAGADMVKAVNALEATRRALVARRTGLRALGELDDQVGSADSPPLRRVLAELRKRIFELIRDEELARLREAFAEDPEAATSDWIDSFAAALAYWRVDLCEALAAGPFTLVGDVPGRADFARWTKRMLHDRWAEAYDAFTFLAGLEFLPAERRAQFLVHVAEIQLYHFFDLVEAAELLGQAEELAPSESIVDHGWAEYLFERGEYDGARQRANRALERDSQSDAILVLGDICERENDLDGAESWYREAVARMSGSASGYLRLARLYSRPDRRADHGWRVPGLLESAIAAEPLNEYRSFLTMGDIEEQSGDFHAAHGWYDRAVSFDPHRMGAYLAKGYVHAAAGELAEAERAFNQAIEVAKDAFDGYWGLAWTHDQQERFPDALVAYEEALERRPAWEARIRLRIAGAQKALGEYDQAAEELLTGLAAARDDDDVLFELHQLVMDTYQQRRDGTAAVQLLERIRALRGDDYEAEFSNRVGNVHFFLNEYWEALQAYRRAVELDDGNGVYHRNLAGALRCVGDWEEARAELQAALERDDDTDSHRLALAMLANDQGNEHFVLGAFDEARELYEESLSYDPDDAVVHSNLGNTWAQTWRPGERMRALEAATTQFRRAAELDGSADAYQAEIEMLEFERRLLDRYGEPARESAASPPQVLAIALGDDLVGEVVEEGTYDLNRRTLGLIHDMRGRLHEQIGLNATPITFRRGEALAPDEYDLYVLERRIDGARAPADGGAGSPVDAMLRHLERVLVASLAEAATAAP